jgi:transposase InsO family protein
MPSRNLPPPVAVTSSTSRPGNPYDDALAENFVATFKTECLKGQMPPTRAAPDQNARQRVASPATAPSLLFLQ